MPIIVQCKHCGSDYSVRSYRISTTKFCSRRCLALAMRTSGTKNCEICGKQFNHISSRASVAKYCSTKCYNKAQSKKGRTTYECRHCGKAFKAPKSHNRIYCSKECVNKGHKSIWKATYTTVRKVLKRKGLIEKCQRCGYSKMPNLLGVHHKDRNRLNNDLSNLEILCPNCHSEEHAKHIVH